MFGYRARMDIKFGTLINVNGTYDRVGVIGTQSVVLHITVKGKDATITIPKDEAAEMAAGLKAALKKIAGE